LISAVGGGRRMKEPREFFEIPEKPRSPEPLFVGAPSPEGPAPPKLILVAAGAPASPGPSFLRAMPQGSPACKKQLIMVGGPSTA